MAMKTCAACSSAVPDGVRLCQADLDTLLDTLWRIPDVIEDLRITFARQDNMRGTEKVIGKSTDTPLSWNDRIPEKLDALTVVLVRWARSVVVQTQQDVMPVIPHTRDPKDPARVPQAIGLATLAARLLAENGPALQRLTWAGDCYSEIVDAVRAATRVVDRPMDRRYLGQCGALVDTVRCETDIYAHPKRAVAQCPKCGEEYDAERRREVLRDAMRDHLEWQTGTAADVAGWLRLSGVNVGTSTVRRWAAQHRLTVAGHNARGHALYRCGEVRELFEKLHDRTKAA